MPQTPGSPLAGDGPGAATARDGNADLTVELWRPPAGEWILVRAETRVGPAGTGSARGVLSDLSGELGSCAQSLLFERRPG